MRSSIFAAASAIAALALVVSACGGAVGDFFDDAADAGDADGGGGGGSGGGNGGGSGGGGSFDASSGDDASSGGDASTRDAAKGDASIPICPSGTPSIPSKQTVHVVVRNTAASERWVIVAPSTAFSPNTCTPFGVRVEPSGKSLPLEPGYQCGCECPAPPPPSYDVQRLQPGETLSFDWDARTVDAAECSLDCNGYHVTSSLYVTKPADPGSYAMVIAADTAAPVDCASTGDPDVYACGGNGWGGGAPTFSTFAPMCPGTATAPSPSAMAVTAPFTLPSSGDVTVHVAIP